MSKNKKETIINELLLEFYQNEIPSYVKSASKNSIDIVVSDFEGSKRLHITIADVIQYYYTQARNIVSGMRCIAGYYGDWRPIDQLANECLEFFKYANRAEVEKQGLEFGMELK